MTAPLRICVTCTHSLTLATLYKGLFPYLLANGCAVDIVIGDREYPVAGQPEFAGTRVRVIPMRRMPSLFHDAIGLLRWTWFLLWHRFDVIHVSTPKASLLAGLAARITFNGRVVFVYRRRVYELMEGRKKRFYIAIDRIIAACSRWIVPISAELGRQLVADGIAQPDRIRLLGSGSSNGIDADRFSLTDETQKLGLALRTDLGIPAEAPLLLFLGRICAEKGLDDVPDVFTRIRSARPDTWMIVAGPEDARDPIAATTTAFFTAQPQIRRAGFVRDARPYFAACDLFIFPSYFEGFGNVLLEAAAMMRPSIGYDVSGVREAIEDGTSGRLVPNGDRTAMAETAIALLNDDAQRAALGEGGRRRVEARFRREAIWAELMALLRETPTAPAATPVIREHRGNA